MEAYSWKCMAAVGVQLLADSKGAPPLSWITVVPCSSVEDGCWSKLLSIGAVSWRSMDLAL